MARIENMALVWCTDGKQMVRREKMVLRWYEPLVPYEENYF